VNNLQNVVVFKGVPVHFDDLDLIPAIHRSQSVNVPEFLWTEDLILSVPAYQSTEDMLASLRAWKTRHVLLSGYHEHHLENLEAIRKEFGSEVTVGMGWIAHPFQITGLDLDFVVCNQLWSIARLVQYRKIEGLDLAILFQDLQGLHNCAKALVAGADFILGPEEMSAFIAEVLGSCGVYQRVHVNDVQYVIKT